MAGAMVVRSTHAKSLVGSAEICAGTTGGPSKKVAKTMRTIAGLVCCGRGWRCISLGDALEQKSCAVFRNVEADFQICMLAIDFGWSGEKREIRLLDSQPTMRIIVNALSQVACRVFRWKPQQETRFRRCLEGNGQPEQLRALQEFSRENGMKRAGQSGRIARDQTQGCFRIERLVAIEKFARDLQIRFQSETHSHQLVHSIGH